MQKLADLDLPFVDVESSAFAADPVSHFREAKARHPWVAVSNMGYWIHDYSAIRELLGKDEKLRPAYDGIIEMMGAHGTPWGRFTEEQLISLPVEEHKQVRQAFASRFTPRFASQLRPMMQETIKGLLDDWAPKGSFDFEEFASYFPISVMFKLVGAPVEEIPNIRASLETLGLAFSMDKARLPEIHAAYDKLEKLVQRVVAERQASPDAGTFGDLLDVLIAAGEEGGIPTRRLEDLIIFFFIAGYDTSKNVLTHIMYQLVQRPEIYERCAVDYDYCRKVLEEGLRDFNPGSVPRFADEDIEFRGVTIPKDTMLWFTLNISGHDALIYPDPESFDPEREIEPQHRHIAFSLGKHICLGQYIARTQLQEALHQIPQRLRNPRLTGEVGWRPYPGAWGLRGLPLTFDPAEAS